jgi:hypothetical protein
MIEQASRSGTDQSPTAFTRYENRPGVSAIMDRKPKQPMEVRCSFDLLQVQSEINKRYSYKNASNKYKIFSMK